MDKKELNRQAEETKKEKPITSLSEFLAPEIEDADEYLLLVDTDACYLF